MGGHLRGSGGEAGGIAVSRGSSELTVLADATGLIQNAVIEVEQKYSAAGVQSGTGAQKLAEVMTLVGRLSHRCLRKAGITAASSYIQSLVLSGGGHSERSGDACDDAQRPAAGSV